MTGLGTGLLVVARRRRRAVRGDGVLAGVRGRDGGGRRRVRPGVPRRVEVGEPAGQRSRACGTRLGHLHRQLPGLQHPGGARRDPDRRRRADRPPWVTPDWSRWWPRPPRSMSWWRADAADVAGPPPVAPRARRAAGSVAGGGPLEAQHGGVLPEFVPGPAKRGQRRVPAGWVVPHPAAAGRTGAAAVAGGVPGRRRRRRRPGAASPRRCRRGTGRLPPRVPGPRPAGRGLQGAQIGRRIGDHQPEADQVGLVQRSGDDVAASRSGMTIRSGSALSATLSRPRAITTSG